MGNFYEKFSSQEKYDEWRKGTDKSLPRKGRWRQVVGRIKKDRQLSVLWVAIGIIGIMFLVPPWKYHIKVEMRGIDISVAGPYRPILLGPPSIPIEETENDGSTTLRTLDTILWHAEVDWTRLFLPVAVIVIVASGLMFTFSERKPSSA